MSDIDIVDGDADQEGAALACGQCRHRAGDHAAGGTAVVQAAETGGGEGHVGIEGVADDHVLGIRGAVVGDHDLVQQAFEGSDGVFQVDLGDGYVIQDGDVEGVAVAVGILPRIWGIAEGFGGVGEACRAAHRCRQCQ